MQTVKIMSDSTCDLSESLKKQYDIGIIPLQVILGEDVYRDGVDVTRDEIYAWADRTKGAPRTAAPVPQEVAQLFEAELARYEEIICFSISESMSASNQTMHLAAQELEAEDRIHVIDSASLSTGIGLLVLEAAKMAMRGQTAEEIVPAVEALKPKVRASFVVDTLTYLHRGGRCSGVTALAGETLKLHPKILVSDGEMVVGKKYRGKVGRAILNYAHDLEDELKNARKERVFITHSGVPKETEQAVYDYLEGLALFKEICITPAGGVVACHCGPGTLGVLFLDS